MALLDPQSQEQITQAASHAARATSVTLGGQFIFGYTINEVAALVGIVVTLAQFAYWVYEKFFKEVPNYGREV